MASDHIEINYQCRRSSQTFKSVNTSSSTVRQHMKGNLSANDGVKRMDQKAKSLPTFKEDT